ncbi:MAG: ATP-binding protein [Methanomassiliicoccaceae archaeon]|jgi:predicted AAA+ superfamily ATPase|nr:ATP-binding protein [Methanomassiliicoccaceae archaeon]
MFRRKMMDLLLEWRAKKKKECLLVKGARQVGKTFIIREFAKRNYENVVELNFVTDPGYKEVFDGSLNMDNIIREITARNDTVRFVPGKTLLFLDEIQECGNARTALKPIAEDGRFDCIASGSMLGIAHKMVRSIPVGYERQVEMHAMDLEEFLWAMGNGEEKIAYMKEYYDSKKVVPASSNEVLLKKLREYAVVGGMPSVVGIYKETNNFGLVHAEQKRIIDSYLDDVERYAKGSDKPKVRACYLSIPEQLAKENRKFQYSLVEEGADARKYENSLEWLRDAGLIKLCRNVSEPVFPLVAYNRKNHFKVYVTDIGILNAMYGFRMKNEVYNNTLTGTAKGWYYENIIADILIKKGLTLNYFKPSEGTQEIEFLLTEEEGIIPIEVKSGNGRTASMNEFIKRFDPPYALKFISGNVGIEGKKVTLPLYMAIFL